MSAYDALHEISGEFNLEWDRDSMISLLCGYIDNQNDEQCLRDYLRRNAEEECTSEEVDFLATIGVGEVISFDEPWLLSAFERAYNQDRATPVKFAVTLYAPYKCTHDTITFQVHGEEIR